MGRNWQAYDSAKGYQDAIHERSRQTETLPKGKPVPVDRPAYDGQHRDKAPETNERPSDPIYRVPVVRDESETIASDQQQRVDNEHANEDLKTQRSALRNQGLDRG